MKRWSETPLWIRRAAIAIALALAGAMILVPLHGSKSKPKPACPVALVNPITDRNGDMYFIFDQENALVVGQLFTGLKNGTCEAGEIWAKDARFQ